MEVRFGPFGGLEDLVLELKTFGEQVAPRKLELDRESKFDRDLFREIGRRGWAGPIVPQEYGGMGAGALVYSIIIEELARAGAPTPQINVQVEKMILEFGTPEQKSLYLPLLAQGRWVAAEAISEPNSGSTLKTMETHAERAGSGYVIYGRKSHVNLAGDADVLAVFAKTESGITVFLVDAPTPGLRFEKRNPIGYRAHPIYDVWLEGVRVPVERRLGPEGRGLDVFIATFNLSRIGNASHMLGVARAALEEMIEYVSRRRVGNHLIKDFQGIRWTVSDLSTRLTGAIVLRNYAAWLYDHEKDPVKEVSMAKLLAGEVAEEVTSKALQIAGSHGAYRDQPFEFYWREVKASQIGGGTAEILRNLIARYILGREEGS